MRMTSERFGSRRRHGSLQYTGGRPRVSALFVRSGSIGAPHHRHGKNARLNVTLDGALLEEGREARAIGDVVCPKELRDMVADCVRTASECFGDLCIAFAFYE
jgi:hypothetical protein